MKQNKPIKQMSDEEVIDGLRRYSRYFRWLAAGTAAGAVISFTVCNATLPPDNFRHSPEYTDLVASARDQFQAVCEKRAEEAHKRDALISVRECVREEAEKKADNSFYTPVNRASLMLAWMFLIQTIGINILLFHAKRFTNPTAQKPDAP